MLFVGDRDNRPLDRRPCRRIDARRRAGRNRRADRGTQPALHRRAAALISSPKIPTATASPSASRFIRSREQFYGRIRQARLSQAAIDVLAIVAYQQPLSAEQIGAVRGKPERRGALATGPPRFAADRAACPASGGPRNTSPPTASCSSSACRPWPTCRKARNSTGSREQRSADRPNVRMRGRLRDQQDAS